MALPLFWASNPVHCVRACGNCGSTDHPMQRSIIELPPCLRPHPPTNSRPLGVGCFCGKTPLIYRVTKSSRSAIAAIHKLFPLCRYPGEATIFSGSHTI